MSGVDLVTVSKLLGHSSIQMTMRYSHPTPEIYRKALESLDRNDLESTIKSVSENVSDK
jgi:site-specific recombinase XerD